MTTEKVERESAAAALECAHAGCGCHVDIAGAYCSEGCRSHAGIIEAISVDPSGSACDCGHAGCSRTATS